MRVARTGMLKLAVTLAASLSVSPPLAAQAPTREAARGIGGRVTDQAGAPIAGVVVGLVGAAEAPASVASRRRDVAVTSDGAGRFTIRVSCARCTLVALRLGFSPETLVVEPSSPPPIFRLRPAPLSLATLVVHARAEPSMTGQLVRDLDVRLRPRESTQELLRLVPGIVIAQHGGGGKAEQIFVRGFDVDHGTDLALSVDGRPVNLVSHAHGQGYADLHFIIPETIERVEVRKGPYAPEDGDFATAGAVAFHTVDRVAHAVGGVRVGSFGTRRAHTLLPIGNARAGGYLAGAVHGSRGPFLAPQRHQRANGLAKWTAPLGGRTELVMSLSGYEARWDASGQVPERLVTAGRLDRFGAIDPTEGGWTARHDASLALRPQDGSGDWELRAYAARYGFRLFSNFTFFLTDSVHGDGIEQVDRRTLAGLEARARRGGWTTGAGMRGDDADVALHHQQQRLRLDPRVDAHVRQANVFAWAAHALTVGERVQLRLGMRGDAFRFSVRDHLASDVTDPDARPANRTRWHPVASPKASLSVAIAEGTTLLASAGAGFHSNDARSVTRAADTLPLIPRAIGAEVEARRVWSGGSTSLTLWRLDLASELVYVGDEGTTEASGRTRRSGIDAEARLRVLPHVWLDADVNLARARFRDLPPGEDAVPLAPRLTSSGGLTVRDWRRVDGGVRYRAVATRPADEAGEVHARGYTVWEAYAARRVGRATVSVSVDNLFDAVWNEAQFATTSRLRDEPMPITELHFTPGHGRALRVAVDYAFGTR